MENTLYYGDNLHILREYIPDESIDLIYLDPPFNSKADYNILFKETTGEQSEAQITAFEDTWHWTEESQRTFEDLPKYASSEVIVMMNSFRRFIGINDMMAYLTMMCIRLIELHRVLKDTGSIYLHCDPTASHYLKILMDTVFGIRNFRNEIIWGYSGGGIPKGDFPRKHDIILRYSKSKTPYYNPIYKTFTLGTVERGRTKVKGNKPLRKEGTPIPDWWFSNLECNHCGKKLSTNIKRIASPTDPEKLGYPTQKSEDLLKRIIVTSTENENSIVLDPFCGCGTTIVAAQALNRKWIGIDITHLAVNLMKFRLNNMFRLEPKNDYKVIGEPEDVAGAIQLAQKNQERYQFQWWALSLINAKPYGDKKKGADTGIDGFMYFYDMVNAKKKELKSIIVQVKSGTVSVKDIRDLGHVIDREKAPMGIFLTLEQPTRPMKKEAAAKGFYKPQLLQKDFPKIQIITIEELLHGRKLELPMLDIPYKKAKRFIPHEPQIDALDESE